MSLASTLRSSAVDALTLDVVAPEYDKLKAMLVLNAEGGLFETIYRFPATFTSDNRQELKTKLEGDGLTLAVDSATGFLSIRW